MKEIIARLNERLDEPLVTTGTVTGEKFIQLGAGRVPTPYEAIKSLLLQQ